MENEFPSRGEINKEIKLYEFNGVEIKKLKFFNLSGSSFMAQDEPSQNSRIWKSIHQSIPCRYFEIEGEAFMLASHEAKLKLIDEIVSSSAKKGWKIAMEEEM